MPEQRWLQQNPGEAPVFCSSCGAPLPVTDDTLKPCQCLRCSDIIQKNADRWLTRN